MSYVLLMLDLNELSESVFGIELKYHLSSL